MANRDIDNFILSGVEFEIELNFGISQLSQYLSELDSIEAGVPFSELGISARRHAQLPTVVSISEQSARTVGDTDLLADFENTPAGSFAHLKLTGVMRSQDGLSTRGISSLAADIQLANENPNIAGIILEANTGGGEAISADILRGVIQDSSKPIVVYAHLLASAGIMGTLPAAEIIASAKTSQFGSIGTYISLPRRLREMYNDSIVDVYADGSPNKNKAFRALLNGDYGPIKQSVNEFNALFQKEVKAWRPLAGDIKETLSGEMFYAQEAQKRGLIDGIGSFNYALQRLAVIAQEPRKAKTYGFRNESEPTIETENQEEMTFKEFFNMLKMEAQKETEAPAVAAVEQQPDQVAQALEAINTRLSAIESINAQMERLAANLDEFSAGIQALQADNQRVSQDLSAINARLDALEGRMSQTETSVVEVKSKGAAAVVNPNSDVPALSQTEAAFQSKIGKKMF